jgi:predicted nucleic acid-binding protein
VWVEVRCPKSSLSLRHLDLGESEAIALAAEMHADVVLMDEQAGRQEAARRGLRVAGTDRWQRTATVSLCSFGPNHHN